jgi:gamma-glutamyltranspeptidase/glutathione hydrolase
LGQALGLREKLGSGLNDFSDIKSLEFLINSLNLAFRTRALHLGDPGYSNLNQAEFLSASTIDSLTSEMKQAPAIEKPRDDFEPIPTSTTHFSIIDFEGNVVSSTQSINLYFGAGFVAEGTGVFLNNTLDDFSKTNRESNAFGLAGRQANFPEGGKTPLSSMSPTIVLNNGQPELVLGSPGGPRIISAVLQTIINHIDYGMDLESAVSSSRIHTQWDPATVYLENRNLKPELESELKRIGFLTKKSDYLVGNVSAVSVNSAGEMSATADPRRDGYGLVLEK